MQLIVVCTRDNYDALHGCIHPHEILEKTVQMWAGSRLLETRSRVVSGLVRTRVHVRVRVRVRVVIGHACMEHIAYIPAILVCGYDKL